jgi:hypothetical protein
MMRNQTFGNFRSRIVLSAKCLFVVAQLLSPATAIAKNTKSDGNTPATPQAFQDMFNAAKANSNGNGNSNHFCAIVVTQPGQLKASPDNMTLSSQIMGGQSGSASIYATNGSFSVSIDPITGFSAQPPGGSANTTFSSAFSATGATNFAETPGQIPQKVKQGTTQIDADFLATRTTDPFPAGNYSSELVLRCE